MTPLRLFQPPPLDEREMEVIDEIDAIHKEIVLAPHAPRQWQGLPWRARQASLAAAGGGAAEAAPAGIVDDPAASGYRAALTFILQLADDLTFTFDEGLIRSLHYMIAGHDPASEPGRWRRTRIFVRRDPSGDLVYTGPEARAVPGLVAELIRTLNAQDDTPLIVRAAMTHLNVSTIHPFVDGNGRLARALQTLVLARGGITAAPFSSIEEFVGANMSDYDTTLQRVHGGGFNSERDTRPWIRFCLRAHYCQATALRRRMGEYDRLWDALEIEIQSRRLPERVASALAGTAVGRRLRNADYGAVTGVSSSVAGRDLKRLEAEGLLRAEGDGRGRWYVASEVVNALRARTRDPHVPDGDPFATI